MPAEKEYYFDKAIAYLRGDPELSGLGPPSPNDVFYAFLKFWDEETPHFRMCVGSVFRAAQQFKRKKVKPKTQGKAPKSKKRGK